MSKPSYSEAAAFSNRVDNFGTSLKTPGEGGPSFKWYRGTPSGKSTAIGLQGTGTEEYIAQHPRYPDYHYPDDKERDTYYEFKQQLAATEPTGRVMASDRDIQYLMDKKNAQELLLFKQFVEDSIPRGTPWAKEYFERFMPGWYQSKIDIIQDKLSIVNRFIDITIRGPQSIEDMFLLYQLYTGKITLPTDWSQLIRPDNQSVWSNEFASGLFNPKKWIKKEYMTALRNQNYLANFAIPGIDAKLAGADANHVEGNDSIFLNRNYFGPNTLSNRSGDLRALFSRVRTEAANPQADNNPRQYI